MYVPRFSHRFVHSVLLCYSNISQRMQVVCNRQKPSIFYLYLTFKSDNFHGTNGGFDVPELLLRACIVATSENKTNKQTKTQKQKGLRDSHINFFLHLQLLLLSPSLVLDIVTRTSCLISKLTHPLCTIDFFFYTTGTLCACVRMCYVRA